MRRTAKNRSLSRSVRRLAHRQPLPQSWPDRIAYALERWRRLPFTLLCSLLLIGSLWLFQRWLVQSNYFAVKQVVYTGNERLSEGVLASFLLSESGLEPGVSALQVNTDALESALAQLPEIKSAAVHKLWPDRIQVDIRERRPDGILVTDTGSHVFDAAGYIFAPAENADLINPEYILVSGFSGQELGTGQTLPAEAHAAIDRYRDVFHFSNPSLAESIGEFNWNSDTGMTLVFDSGQRFVCGNRLPEVTGPVIERLIEENPADSTIALATINSDLYATVRRAEKPVNDAVETNSIPEGGIR